MGTLYYAILVLIIISFLACIVFTVFDNNKGIPKPEKKMTTFRSRRTLYSDYLEKVSNNNYYSYNYYKKKDDFADIERLDEEPVEVYEDPIVTSIMEVNDGFLNNTQSIIPVLDI